VERIAYLHVLFFNVDEAPSVIAAVLGSTDALTMNTDASVHNFILSEVRTIAPPLLLSPITKDPILMNRLFFLFPSEAA
jgi:hypothetical protein